MMLLALLALAYTSMDEGCTLRKPASCGKDPKTLQSICKQTYAECEAFEGCTDAERPFMCSNGECEADFTQCKEKYFNCDGLKYSNKYEEVHGRHMPQDMRDSSQFLRFRLSVEVQRRSLC